MLAIQDFAKHVIFPQPPTAKGNGLNSIVDKDYKQYTTTAKNCPASLKGKADQTQKSEGDLAGYKGDVLKSNLQSREGKGI